MDFKNWFRKNFARDIQFRVRAVVYIGFSSLNVLMSFGVLLYRTFLIPETSFIRGYTLLIAGIALILSLVILDKVKNRTGLINILLLTNTAGFFLVILDNFVIMLIGRGIVFFCSIWIMILGIGVFIHETNILNRGRMVAYLFFIVAFCSIFMLFLIMNYVLQSIFLIPMGIACVFNIVILKYSYVETEFRLKSKVTFAQTIKNRENLGYLVSFLIISFVFGLDYLRFNINLNFSLMYIVSMIMVIIFGVLIDNVGRKPVLIGTIFLLAIFTIFAADTTNSPVWVTDFISIYYGLVLNLAIILFITYSGDSTRDEFRKYRNLIVGLYILGVVIGFSAGNLIGNYFIDTFNANPVQNANYPEFINKIGILSLVVLLILIYPLRDSLKPGENDWFIALRQLYVFENGGVCLYSYDFTSDIIKAENSRKLLKNLEEDGKPVSDDLVSGGLSGVVGIIQEITHSKKKLRVVDHEDKKILFYYGKRTIFTLITTKYMNVLISKLKDFGTEFEEIYDFALQKFNGALYPFDDTRFLVDKHFKQKFFNEIHSP